MGPNPKPVRDRLLSLSDVSGACRVWTGSRNNSGYGMIRIGSIANGTRRYALAHRIAYETWKGPISDGLHVCHACDNRLCIAPDHLFLGTAKDNSDDKIAKGRYRDGSVIGEAHHNCKLTTDQVRDMRALSLVLERSKLAQLFLVSVAHVGHILRFQARALG